VGLDGPLALHILRVGMFAASTRPGRWWTGRPKPTAD
jgi:hypothetical protein